MTKQQLRNRNNINNDWTLHLAFNWDPKKPIRYRTQGLEKYGLKNICMECVGEELVKTCEKIINGIVGDMIDGEIFDTNMIHYVYDDYGKLTDVFYAKDIKYHGEEYTKICYFFDNEFVYPKDGMTYKFDSKSCKWNPINN